MKLRRKAGRWVATSVLFLCLSACSSKDASASVQGSEAPSPGSPDTDCSHIGAAKDRDACLLALPEAACRKLGKACLSLRDARARGDTLAQLEKNIISKARARYASYAADDPAYLDDMEKSFTAASQAWRAYRDAYCQAEPMVQGMSRDEQQALAEDCAANVTRARIAQLEQLARAIP